MNSNGDVNMDQMKAMVLHGISDVRAASVPKPHVGVRDVLVRMVRVGVCGSDVHYFTHGRIGDFVVREPLILGHESAGIVEAVGPDVTRFKPGDRVCLEPGYTCRRCFFCKRGQYNLCPDVTFMATPPIDGAYCEYVAWPDDFVFALPDDVSLEAGSMMEPLSVGVWAVERGKVKSGHLVAVFGCGPIGCLTLAAAKDAGATTLVAVDIAENRLGFARRYGATHVIDGSRKDAVERIRNLGAERTGLPFERSGADVTFETAGAVVTTRQTLAAVRPGGAAVLVGLPPEPMVELDIVDAASKEIDIRGQFRYANCYPTAIGLAASGRVRLDEMITHHFPLAEVADALRFADSHKGESMKLMIDVAGK